MTHEEHEIAQDVRAVAGSLDRLAAAERASATSALEDRLFMASRGDLRAGAGSESPARARTEPVAEAPVFRLGWLLSGLRLAACIAVVGSGVAAWLAVSHTPAAAPSPDPDLMAWLNASSSDEDGLSDLGSQIDLLRAELISVSAMLEDPTASDDGAAGKEAM